MCHSADGERRINLFEVEEETSVKASKVPTPSCEEYLRVDDSRGDITRESLQASGPFLPEYVKASIDQWDLVEGNVESLSWETEQL